MFFLFLVVEVAVDGAEVVAVDEEAVFGSAAEEAAVEAGIVHLEQEGFLPRGQGGLGGMGLTLLFHCCFSLVYIL